MNSRSCHPRALGPDEGAINSAGIFGDFFSTRERACAPRAPACIGRGWGRVRRAWQLAALLSLFILAHGANLWALEPNLLPPRPAPPLVDGRVRVEVGLFFINLLTLDEVRQEFRFVAYLFAKWKDPRLAVAGDGPQAPRSYDPNALWLPLLEINNSAIPRQVSSREVLVDPDGTVHYVEKFTTTVQTELQFRAFPFDSQKLDVYIHPFISDAGVMSLRLYKERSGMSSEPYATLHLWHLGRVSQDENASPGASTSLRFRASVRRESQYYVWRMFLPLFLLVCMSWSVLWMPPGDLSNQVLISVSTIFTLVVFSSAISSFIPAVPYLTFYDAFFLVCYVFVLLTAAEVLAVHRTHRRTSHDSASRLRRLFRWLIPIAFCASIATIVVSFSIGH
jgi:hypothetical protein